MNPSDAPTSPHRWRFFRSGGFDQVRIESADDLQHLGELDQKLWSVLACPTGGLEFDARTLELMDTDGDGRIRAPEVLHAVAWVCTVLQDPDVLFQDRPALPLAAIDGASTEGAALLSSAARVLAILGKPGADAIAVADLADTARLLPANQCNGDGVVPVELANDPVLAAAIQRIIETSGAVTDRSGQPGLDRERLAGFFADARAVVDWHDRLAASPAELMPLGEATAAAVAAWDAVRDKVEDHFTRCRLAAFDARAAEVLNPGDAAYAGWAAHLLDAAAPEVGALPLALAAPGAGLPLVDGLNPAWEARIAELRERVVQPLLGAVAVLTHAQWRELACRLDAHRAWSAAKPDSPVADIPLDDLRAMLAGSQQADLETLIGQDEAAVEWPGQIEALERLTRYHRDLVTLLRNFVTLSDFYVAGHKAIFQAGTLYLDQRSCELCLRVADMARHATLAPLSGTYLVYCQCTRQGEAPMTIVAAMTGGDADEMMVPGRNGVFYDRQGRDWQASVVKVVENPISVRQAFWMPYRRVGRMLGEQVRKFAASRDQAVDSKAAAGVAAAPSPAATPAFDIAKFAGIFAAIGLALGALGTALVAVVTGFLSLPAWQMPLVLLGVMLLISGPSMLLAWFKLRQRNLGPLLDANGWAVNTRARINIPFGASLTGVAILPPGARRARSDPYADRRPPWRSALLLLVGLALLLVWWRSAALLH